MFFELTEEQKEIKQRAKDYAEKRIAVVQEEDYDKGVFRPEIVKEMGELGFFAGVVPEEYGGNNVGFLGTVLCVEELGRVSASYCMLPTPQTVGPGLTILRHGTEEQKDKYVRGLASGDIIGCFSSTEPDAGSDVAAMKMVAVDKGDRFILNGTKTWATGGSAADMGLFWAYTDKEKGSRGISCFIVDLKDSPGISTHLIEELGLHCCRASEVAFQDVEIPKDCLLGNRGEGYGILMETLGETRLCAGTRALGLGQACLDDCINFVKERRQAGQKIGNLQLVEAKIAEMYIEHEAARMLIYQVAANKDRGTGEPLDVPAAKYVACEAAVKAAETAMEIFGSFGFPSNMALRRYMNDSRCFPITEGTRNILKLVISRRLLR